VSEKRRCCKIVHGADRTFRGSPCLRTGTLEHGGKWYCATHYPPHADARQQQRRDKMYARIDDERKRSDKAQAIYTAAARVVEAAEKWRESFNETHNKNAAASSVLIEAVDALRKARNT